MGVSSSAARCVFPCVVMFLATAVAVTLSLPGSADSAPEAFPGANGLIAFTRVGPPCGVSGASAVCAEAIWVSSLNGTKLRRVSTPKSRHEVHRNPTWSPDGRRIAYIANTAHRGNGRFYELWMAGADGSGTKRVLDHSRIGAWLSMFDPPSWSPSGRELYFQVESTVRAVDVVTGKVRTVGGLPGRAENARVSPNGRLVAFITRNDWGDSRVSVKPLASAAPQRRLATVYGGPYFSWSPDSSRIVYVADCMKLATVSVSGGQPTDVYSEQRGGWCWPRPVWSPDGSTILFQRSLAPGAAGGDDIIDRFSTVGLDGSGAEYVGPGSASCQVFTHNPETRKRTRVPCTVSYPDWQPRT